MFDRACFVHDEFPGVAMVKEHALCDCSLLCYPERGGEPGKVTAEAAACCCAAKMTQT